MKLTKLGNNKIELNLDNAQVLVSYETPVAACINNQFFRTSKKWSVTTSKHITQWLEGIKAEERDQSFFDKLLEV